MANTTGSLTHARECLEEARQGLDDAEHQTTDPVPSNHQYALRMLAGAIDDLIKIQADLPVREGFPRSSAEMINWEDLSNEELEQIINGEEMPDVEDKDEEIQEAQDVIEEAAADLDSTSGIDPKIQIKRVANAARDLAMVLRNINDDRGVIFQRLSAQSESTVAVLERVVEADQARKQLRRDANDTAKSIRKQIHQVEEAVKARKEADSQLRRGIDITHEALARLMGLYSGDGDVDLAINYLENNLDGVPAIPDVPEILDDYREKFRELQDQVDGIREDLDDTADEVIKRAEEDRVSSLETDVTAMRRKVYKVIDVRMEEISERLDEVEEWKEKRTVDRPTIINAARQVHDRSPLGEESSEEGGPYPGAIAWDELSLSPGTIKQIVKTELGDGATNIETMNRGVCFTAWEGEEVEKECRVHPTLRVEEWDEKKQWRGHGVLTETLREAYLDWCDENGTSPEHLDTRDAEDGGSPPDPFEPSLHIAIFPHDVRDALDDLAEAYEYNDAQIAQAALTEIRRCAIRDLDDPRAEEGPIERFDSLNINLTASKVRDVINLADLKVEEMIPPEGGTIPSIQVQGVWYKIDRELNVEATSSTARVTQIEFIEHRLKSAYLEQMGGSTEEGATSPDYAIGVDPSAEVLAKKLRRMESHLHANEMHPDFEYETTRGARKAFDEHPPSGEGWERNVDKGRDGWERFDFTEEAYWRRPKDQS